MAGYPKEVEITKTVPVNDHPSLVEWLNQQLEAWFERSSGSCDDYDTVGAKAIALIVEAGFELKPPSYIRELNL